MDMENPKAKDVESVRDWVQDTGAIARVETAFLTRPGAEADLMNVADVSETAHVTSVEPHVEEPSVAAYVPSGGVSAFPHLFAVHSFTPENQLSRGDHIFSGETVRRLGRSINIWFSAPLLIAPIVGLYTLQSTALRSTVTVLFVAAFGISASSLGNVKTPEISLATAAYLAVFAVLVSVAGSK